MITAFSAGQGIKDIENAPPLRITYQNGDQMEIAFTDGQVNPNRRITDLFDRAANEPDKVKIKHVIFSHFVLSNGGLVKSLRGAMKAQTGFKVFGIFDDRFIDLRGYGLATELNGFDVLLPYGKVEFGVGDAIDGRTELYAYQRGIPNEIETTLEGPPDKRLLWHDKTTYIEVEIDGKLYAYIFTGSFNGSNILHNAERQVMLITTPDSVIARSVRASDIERMIEVEREYLVRLPLAVLRNEDRKNHCP